jgi:hypothetical protein
MLCGLRQAETARDSLRTRERQGAAGDCYNEELRIPRNERGNDGRVRRVDKSMSRLVDEADVELACGVC